MLCRLTRESSLAADDSNIVQEDESVSEHGTDLEKIEDNDTETKEPGKTGIQTRPASDSVVASENTIFSF